MYTLATPMKADRRRGGRRAATLSIGRRLFTACALLSLASLAHANQQPQPASSSPLQAAVRALNAGRFDQVIGLGHAGKLAWMFIGGLLIGFGTRLGGGCTSGHGIFGLSKPGGCG